jgi:peptidoglycan/xylan/chitin deacetylase (PgdA/CDA1 family)
VSADAALTRVPGDDRGRVVALTFDDGPGPDTPALLDVLRERAVRATFFVTGAHVTAYPDLARRIVAEGHAVGNHTYSHPQDVPGSTPRGNFDRLPPDEQARQLDDTTRRVASVTGVTPRCFRAPGGWHFSVTTQRLAAERGLAVVHWTVDSEDWRAPGRLDPEWITRITRRAVGAIGPTGGDPDAPAVRRPIVLLHDAKASAEPEEEISAFRGNTVAAVPAIIDAYKDRGFEFADPLGTVW